MKLLTKNTDYAVRALLALSASKERYVSAKEIAVKERIPYQYLRKILQELIKSGIVRAKEGGNGGVRIQRTPEKIKLADIIRLFQGAITLSECVFRRKICQNRNKCVLRENILRIEKMVTREFENVTVKDLLKKRKRG